MTRLLAALGLAVVLASAAAARGADAPSCHCFRDRTFDPSRPSGADAYILAAARNSLLSAAFGVSKASLIQAEMTGSSPDDLWVAHWAGARAERDPGALLSQRQAGGSWQFALADVDARKLGPPFERALRAGAPGVALASVAVDDVVIGRLRAPASSVTALRAAGASSAETVVAALVARRTGRRAEEHLRAVRQNAATWGTLLRDAGLAPSDLDAVIRSALR